MEKVFQSIGRAFELVTIENMDSVNQITWRIGKVDLVINVTTIIMTWIVMIIIILFSYLGVRKLKKYPGKVQALVELIIDGLDKLIKDTMGEVGRKYLPLIATLFFFVAFSNWLGVIPLLKSPTGDLNTTLGLGILVFLIVQGSGIATKGLFSYLKGFLEPLVIAPLAVVINLAGEFGKTVSHSFRLFGNILGGGLIIIVLSDLFKYLLIPPVLHAFFGLFIGAVQAFVFGMLALVYITVGRGE
ncbi:MAG: F0F1 ATP synthase subunit A [bacterium]|nr:F0F1 ATP synthase subunit A [bacterium]